MAASNASRSSSSKRSAARAGSVGEDRREPDEAVARLVAGGDARLGERLRDEGAGLRPLRRGARGEGGAHRLAFFLGCGETRGAREGGARESERLFARREGEESGHAIRPHAGSCRESDPRGQAREAERRCVESGDEGSGGAVALRECEGCGEEARPQGRGFGGGRRRIGCRRRPGEASRGKRAREKENPESQLLSSPSRAPRPDRRRGCARARRGRSPCPGGRRRTSFRRTHGGSSRCRP